MGASLTTGAAMAYPLLTVDANPESSPEAHDAAPNRPATVPETGVWNAEVGKWEVSRKDDHGARDGERLLYRDDGTLFSRARFVAGVQDGPFVVYHRDGDVAREGHVCVRDARRARDRLRVRTSPAGERISCLLRSRPARPACASATGRASSCVEVFYDREGRALLSDGRLCPARPDGLPELAQFDESRGGWVLRSRELDRFVERGRHADRGDRPHGRGRARRAPLRRRAAGCGRRPVSRRRRMTSRTGRSTGRFPDAEPSPYADAAHPRGAGRVRRAGSPSGAGRSSTPTGRSCAPSIAAIAFRDGDEPEAHAGGGAGRCGRRLAGAGARARGGRTGARGVRGGGARRGGDAAIARRCSSACAPSTSCR